MAARDTMRRLVRGPLGRARAAIFPEYRNLLRDVPLLFESVAAAHQGISDLQAEQRALRERLDMTLELAESHLPRLAELEDAIFEARRLNLRIAELTDVVTELVLPLHDRDIDPAALQRLGADTL
jgi:hypothetical protein